LPSSFSRRHPRIDPRTLTRYTAGMAIQFNCPACRQPIEVDDEWGSQHVHCPFCKRVVTAPTMSTLTDQELASVETARKITEGKSYSPPHRVPVGPPKFNQMAIGGVGCSFLAIFLFLVSFIMINLLIQEHLGPAAMPEEAQSKMFEIMSDPTSGQQLKIVGPMCLSFCFWMAGVCLSSISLVNSHQKGRKLAVVGIIASGFLPLLCLLSFLMSL